MEKKYSKRKLRYLVSDAKIQEALQLIMENFEGRDSKLYNEAVLLASQLNGLNKDRVTGLITSEDFSRRLNRISFSILNLIDEIQEETFLFIEEFRDNIKFHFSQGDNQALFDELIKGAGESNHSLINRTIVTKSEFSGLINELESISPKKSKNIRSEFDEKVEFKILSIVEQTQSDLVTPELISEILYELNQELEELKKNVQIAREEEKGDLNKESILKILYLYSNPENLHTIAFGKESKIISEELQKGKNRSKYNFLPPVGAVRYDELKSIIEKSKADIVHISVHGAEEKGLLFEDRNNYPRPINIKQLIVTFEQAQKKNGQRLKCILINACNSAEHSEVLAKKGICDFSIGMGDYIPDEAALAYTQGFYETLFNTDSFTEAHDNGYYKIVMEAIQVEGFEEKQWEEVPKLFPNK